MGDLHDSNAGHPASPLPAEVQLKQAATATPTGCFLDFACQSCAFPAPETMLKQPFLQLLSWFKTRSAAEQRSNDSEDDQPQYFTREEALVISREQAGSSFTEKPGLISYTI